MSKKSEADQRLIRSDQELLPGLSQQPLLGAVIDIGATSVRLAIGEVNSQGALRVIENLAIPVSLGMDTFISGRIERKTISAAIRALRLYRQKIAEYQIDSPAQVRVVATSAVREARNRLEFIDRVFNLTGFAVEPFDEADVHRVTYLGILRILESSAEFGQGLTCAIEVGGGSTETLLLDSGSVEFANTFRLGALRMRRTLDAYRTPTERVREIMESEIGRVADRLGQQLGSRVLDRMLVMGGDIRLAARLLQNEREPQMVEAIEVDALLELVETVWRTSADQLVSRYRLSIADAESMGPALMAYGFLAKKFSQSHVYVANTNLREGVLLDMAGGRRAAGIRPQILSSVAAIAAKYGVDVKHARQVCRVSEQLYQDLAADFDLTDNCLLILQVAAWLHEIGMFVNIRSYHKHSLYLIRSSEFFGISARNLELAALVARYHRRASPQPQHEYYSGLDRKDRSIVCKLAAILRVAKALDVARNGRVNRFRLERSANRLVIHVGNVQDLTLENLELQLSGTLFEDTFGIRVVLGTESR
jgi:exopolyphosphatase / guanosine-5'-triphosphate,3'-diphosphate pyrophosphatase